MDNNNTLSDNISLSKDFINAYTLQYYHYLTTAKQVLILGAGFGGLASANLLRKSLPREGCQITVIDKNQYFMMGIVNLWILSGSRRLEDSQVALSKLGDKGIKFLNDEITDIDPSENSITTRTKHNKLE
jgi:sulfide:quinone oxidoreductase